MSVRDDEVRDDSTSFEVERHTDDQPPRDDLIEPDDIRAAEAEMDGPPDAGAGVVDDPDPFNRDDEPPRAGTDPDDLPESQGFDADVADQLTEDGGTIPLSDEERGGL